MEYWGSAALQSMTGWSKTNLQLYYLNLSFNANVLRGL